MHEGARTAKHSAQHRTAQHSTAQHSTGPHNTAQYGTVLQRTAAHGRAGQGKKREQTSREKFEIVLQTKNLKEATERQETIGKASKKNNREMVKGDSLYVHRFIWSFGGTEKIRAWNVPALARNALKFNSDALA